MQFQRLESHGGCGTCAWSVCFDTVHAPTTCTSLQLPVTCVTLIVYCSHPAIECFGHAVGGCLVSISFAVMAEAYTNSWQQLDPLQRAWVKSHAFSSRFCDHVCMVGMKIMLRVCLVQAVYLLIQAGAAAPCIHCTRAVCELAL